MDGNRADLGEFGGKSNTDDDFPPPYTNNFVGADNNCLRLFGRISVTRQEELESLLGSLLLSLSKESGHPNLDVIIQV